MSHRISFKVYGEGAPIVLLHGYGGNASQWDSLVPQLATKYKVYVSNLTGLLLSREDLFLSVQVMSIMQSVERMGIEKPFSVLGMSYGAMLGMGLACFLPDQIYRVILVNPMVLDPIPKFMPPEIRYFFVSQMSREDVSYTLNTKIGEAFLKKAAQIFNPNQDLGRFEVGGSRKQSFFAHLVHRLGWTLQQEDWELWKERLRVQSSRKLMIYDKNDPLFSEKTYREYHIGLLNCEIFHTQGGGHLCLNSQSHAIGKRILEFLSEQDPVIEGRRAS